MNAFKIIARLTLLFGIFNLYACVDESTSAEKSSASSDAQKTLQMTVVPNLGTNTLATNLEVITLFFNKAIDVTNLNKNQIVATPNIKFHIDTSLLSSRRTLFLLLDEKLQADTYYKFTINNVKDKNSGKPQSFEWEYTTLVSDDLSAPFIQSSSPSSDANSISDQLNRIEVNFNEDIRLSSLQNVVITPAIAGTAAVVGNKFIYTPSTSLLANQNYLITVSGISDLYGNNAADISLNFSTGADTTAPAVSNLSLATLPGTSTTSLRWSASSDISGITSYEIKRGTNNQNLSTIATLSNNTLTFNDSGLTANSQYFYQLLVNDTAGNTSNSSIISAQTAAVPATPDTTAPVAGSLSLNGSPTASSLQLQWPPASDNTGILQYRLMRSTNGGSQTLITTINNNSNASSYLYTDNTVSANTSYTYRVVVTDTSNNQASSNILTANTPAATPAVTSPVTLSWQVPTRNTDESCLTNLQSFTVQSKASTGSYSQLSTLLVNSTELTCSAVSTDAVCGVSIMSCSYTTTPITAGTWTFRVQSINADGIISGYSNEATTTIN